MKNNWIALACVTTVLGFQANAVTFTYNANTDGVNAPAGVSFTPAGGALGTKDIAGYTTLGVTGGPSGNEIDLNQSLTIDFAQPVLFEYLTLSLLFDGPEFGDNNEIAAVLTDGLTELLLTATGLNTATWTGAGSVTNLSPADGSNGAVWQIDNPFAGPVSSLKLYPLSSNPTGNESDFGLNAFKAHTQAVPEPATGLAGLLALGGLVWLRRSAKR